MYILRLGSMDVKGLLKAVGEDGFLKHVSCLLQKCKLRVVIQCLNVFFSCQETVQLPHLRTCSLSYKKRVLLQCKTCCKDAVKFVRCSDALIRGGEILKVKIRS